MKPTPRGWALGGVSVALYAAGRVFGTIELSMLAAGGAVTLALAAVVARLGRADVVTRRHLHPARLHVGTSAHVELQLTNRGDRRTSVLSVSDRFGSHREAKLAVPPLAPGETTRGAYRLPTSRRGVHRVGPIRVSVTDPFGLVQRVVRSGGEGRVTIFPRVEHVESLPITTASDLVGGAVAAYSRSRAGHEFHSLREYLVGDDLRQVHWRSTARTGTLMIREHDVPWQSRATILVDDGSPAGETFERMIEAAASTTLALQRSRAIARLLTCGSGETGFGSGGDHYDTLLERLAGLRSVRDVSLVSSAARLNRRGGAGALLVFTARTLPDWALLAPLHRRFGTLVVVTAGPAPGEPPPGVRLVRTDRSRPFAEAWRDDLVRQAR